MLAVTTNYPLLEVFWTMLIFFAFIVWIWILFIVFADIFRRKDASGFVKVLWIVFVILFPYLGVFVYLIAEHKGMAQRQAEAQQTAQAEMTSYIQEAAGKQSPAEQIAKAKELLDNGTISQAEFDQMKGRALAS
jgi:ABC-type multidrug transport system fused ATPase/permease subunit